MREKEGGERGETGGTGRESEGRRENRIRLPTIPFSSTLTTSQ